MHRRVYDLALASLVVIGAALGMSNCSSDTVVKPSGMVQPLHATGQTNTQPPVIIDATLLPGTTSGGQQPITGTYTATPVGGASFSGTIFGTVAGTFDGGSNGGNFTGTVTVAAGSNGGSFTSQLPNGCTAARPYQGSLTRTTLAWVGQTPTNTCNGTSPLTFDISLSVTDGAPEPTSPPSVVLAQTAASVSNAQQTGTAQITANAVWTAASNQSWLTISSGGSGGNGTTTLTYAVQANPGPARIGTITIAHGSTTATLTVTQAGATSSPPPTIATQPQSQSIVSGQTATLSVTAAGTAPFSYQWFVGTSPTTTNPIAGATASSYTTPALTNTTSYWVRVTNAAGSVDSGTATITVTISVTPPTIATQPQSQSIVSGQTATLSVTAAGTAPFSYQWYVGSSPTTTNPIAGATASSYTTPALTSTTSYWVRVTNAGGSADSGTATITVTTTVTPPTIATQPQSQTIGSGQTGTLSVTAAGTAPFSYQWYVGSSPTTTNPIAGATASSYTTPALTSTTSYWVRVTNAAGSVDSGTATITVTTSATPPSITAQPQSQTIGSGQTATLSVTAAGTAPLSYQWYVGTSPTTTNPIAGATASSYTTPALTSTTSYWVRVTNAGGSVDSATATITVVTAPTITTQPQSQTIGSGQTATLSVTAAGTAPLSYQWYVGTSPTTTNPIAGATASSYTTPALTSTTSYWVRVTNAGGSVDSATATITVVTAPTITTQPQSQTIGSGQTATLSVTAAGTAPLSYQWYVGTSPTTTNPIAGATASSYTTPALTSTTSYWVRVTNAGGSVNSATATITVTGPSIISWVYNLRVHGTVVGTPTGGGGPTTVTVPLGTPLTINLSFNSATPNGCTDPASQGGAYAIGSGNNSASITFLGYQYSTFGGIEVGGFGFCNRNGVSSGLRLFVNAGSQIGQGGTLVQWVNQPSNGAMFIDGPSASAPGLLPTILPSNPFSTGGSIFPSSTVQLTIESGQITVGPEPVADLLLGTGVVGLAMSRRLARRQKVRR